MSRSRVRQRAAAAGCVAAALAVVVLGAPPFVGAAGATTGTTGSGATGTGASQIGATQQQATTLEATIARQQQQTAALSQRFDAAQQQIQTLQTQMAATTDRLAMTRAEIATERSRLAKDAVHAYMYGDVATQIAALFSTSANGIDDRAEYESTVIGDVTTEAAALGKTQARLLAVQTRLRSEDHAAQTAAQQVVVLRQANATATAQAEATLHRVQGTLAQEVAAAAQAKALQEAAAAAAARSAAAAQAAAAQAAAAASVASAVGSTSTGVAAITAANQAAAAASHDQGGPPTAPSTPVSVSSSGGSSNAGMAAVHAATSQLGVPYVWGGEMPGVGFDCSGLTQWAWAQAGVSIPRTAASQYAAVPRVPLNALEPGDLLFYFNLDGDGIVDHVVMYVGSGPYGNQTIIQAPETGETVSYAPLYTFGLIGAGQP
ncbi:MAG: C40 family peptidase [Acidimicrobiales bacterium]